MSRTRNLLVLPSLPVCIVSDGRFGITRKFVSGMQQYVDRWPGPVTAVMQTTEQRTGDLDQMVVAAADLPFALETMSLHSQEFVAEVAQSAIVLAGIDWRQNHVVPLCVAQRTPVVVCAEYTLETRCQIVRTETPNPLRRARRVFWEWNQERANRRSVAQATGVQCNGMPTFNGYRALNPHTMVYFDTRTPHEMLQSGLFLDERLQYLSTAKPLRLAFSGRLIAMKGADHLIAIAATLRDLRVPFHFTIFGDGALRNQLQQTIERRRLTTCVSLAGNVDFTNELLPTLRREIDLFVCPHRQGDPSCTYLETLSCGVPIAGYANEAWSGLLQLVDAGWSTPLDNPGLLAAAIANIAGDRALLAQKSRQAFAFAQQHSFEHTFQARIEHLIECSQRWRVEPIVTHEALGELSPSSLEV